MAINHFNPVFSLINQGLNITKRRKKQGRYILWHFAARSLLAQHYYFWKEQKRKRAYITSKKTTQTLAWASLPFPKQRLTSLLFSTPNNVDVEGLGKEVVEEVRKDFYMRWQQRVAWGDLRGAGRVWNHRYSSRGREMSKAARKGL